MLRLLPRAPLPVLVGASLGGISALLAQGEAEEPVCAALVLSVLAMLQVRKIAARG